MVELLRKIEQFDESPKFEIKEREQNYRKNTKKIPLTLHSLQKGHKLTMEDLTFLRTEEKVEEILDIDEIVGKTLNQELKPLAPITRKIFS
jgi:sialic acid synthase SpsE